MSDDHLRGVPSNRELDAFERQVDLSLRRADDATQGRRPVRRRSPWLVAFTVLLAVALVGTAALAAYLWRTTDEWRAEADQRADLATQLADQRDEIAGELDQTERDLEATEAQLLELQERLLSLADERAQTGDELEMTRLLAEDIAGFVTELQEITADLRQCVQGQGQLQEQLIDVLENIELYDPDSVVDEAQRVSGLVNQICQQALERHEDLQERLQNR